MSESDEKEFEDPLNQLRDECYQKDCHVKKLNTIFKACEDRVNSKSYTAETCAQEITDLMEALDHCVGDKLFKHLV